MCARTRGPPMSDPSACTSPLEMLAPVVADGRDEEVQIPRRRARLPAVQVGANEMARTDEASVEGEELEVVRRRRVRISWHGPTVSRIAAHGPRRSWVEEARPTG